MSVVAHRDVAQPSDGQQARTRSALAARLAALELDEAGELQRPFLGCIIHPGRNGAYGWTDPMLTCALARGDDNTDYERANFVSVRVENHTKRCAKTWGGLNL